MQIKNLMSTSLITIDKDQSLADALKLLRKNRISRLPVLNNKELTGIISERDIAKKLGSSKYESMPASRLHVSSVMVKDIISVPQSMRLAEVANILLEKELIFAENLEEIFGKRDFGHAEEQPAVEEKETPAAEESPEASQSSDSQ